MEGGEELRTDERGEGTTDGEDSSVSGGRGVPSHSQTKGIPHCVTGVGGCACVCVFTST